MRLRLFALLALLLFGVSCKKFFQFGRPDDAGTGSSSGGGLLSTLTSLIGFEGEIDMGITFGTMPGASSMAMTINMKLKGDKVRMDVSMPNMPSMAGMTGATIMDAGKKKSWTLMPTTKEYMETDLDPAAKPTVPAPPPGPKPIVTKTGRTDKIAGFSCDIITVTHPGHAGSERQELCVSKGLTFLGMGVGPFSKLGADSEWGDALKDGFPLRIESYDASGALSMKMEATRIEKKSESDSDFEIPTGYKKMVTPTYPAPPPPPPTGGYTF